MAEYWVIEGRHQDPMERHTIIPSTAQRHGPFADFTAAQHTAQRLMQKQVDDYYHRAWITTDKLNQLDSN